MSNTTLTPTQLQVHQSTHNRRLVRHGRRWGGTTLAVYEAITNARTNRGTVNVVLVPTTNNAYSVHNTYLKRMTKSHEFVMANREKMIYVLKNASVIMLVGADDEYAMEDICADYCAVDGASDDGMVEYFQENIRPNMVGERKMLITFTPYQDECFSMDWLYCEEQNGRFENFHFKSLDGNRVPIEELDGIRPIIGEEAYATEFEGEWPYRLRRRAA